MKSLRAYVEHVDLHGFGRLHRPQMGSLSHLNIRPITMKMVLLDRKNHTILAASTNAGSTLMLGTRRGLSVVFVSLATLLIGVGEARSQAAQLQV